MDFSNYLRFIFALIFVLALIALLSWLIKRFGYGGRYMPARGQARRLRVIESVNVDAKRRAVLLRCDEREHLLLIGGASDVVVEAGRAAPPPAVSAGPEAPNKSAETGK